ncbi:MAG: HD domain-containing protein [Clostridia bacterium]|nr:HD domain-containing protein [Clostridia bacterium]
MFQLQHALLFTLINIVENRDGETGEHARRTATFVTIIADELSKKGVYKEQLTEEYIDELYYVAPLHDIGKISTPDAILNKPDRLTKEEFYEMKEHTIHGGDIIQNIIDNLSPTSRFIPSLQIAKDIAMYHHEKWDGSGYPLHLKGEEIPLSARIMAVADVFDALTSKRCYKKRLSTKEATSFIKKESGHSFDPFVVNAFLNCVDDLVTC